MRRAVVLLLVTLLVAGTVALTGCGDGDGGSIVGTYVYEEEGLGQIELKSDGTVVVSLKGMDPETGQFEVKGDTLRIFDDSDEALFTISGDTLIDDEGKNWIKQGTTDKTTPQEPDDGDTGSGATISKAEYDQLELLMTYEEVVRLIGGPGKEEREIGDPGSPARVILYSWKAEWAPDAEVFMTFSEGVLQFWRATELNE